MMVFMKRYFSKFFSLIVAAACLASPLHLMAGPSGNGGNCICKKSVAGTYQISADSNSFPGAPLNIEAQAATGQVILHKDGTATVPFVNFTVVTTGGTIVSTPFTNVTGTYTLGPVEGQGYLTLNNFPSAGANPVFALSFKRHEGKVVGFSAVTTVNTTSNLVTLIQAVRFS